MKSSCKSGLWVFLLLLISISPLTAQDFSVDFVDGYAEAIIGGRWDEVYIGDELGLSSKIKLETSTVVELSADGVSITLTKPGTYSLRDLYSQAANRDNIGLGNLVGSKINSMFGKSYTSDVPTAVGGVRGDSIAGADDFGWIESEVDEIIDSGIAALERNEFDRALDYFLEAYDYSLDKSEENKSLFYIGYTYSLLGETDESLDYLEEIEGEPQGEIYAPFYLLRGKLMVETFDYSGAVDFLAGFDPAEGTTEDEQVVYFLMGYAHKNMNNSSEASAFLTKAYNLERSSDVGKTAYRLMNN